MIKINLDAFDERKEESIDFLNKLEKIISLENDEIEKHNIILESLEEKFIKMIKKECYYYFIFLEEELKLAFNYKIYNYDNKSKEFKAYKDIVESISYNFFCSEKIELLDIDCYGDDNYAYGFKILYKKFNFYIKFPCLSHININNRRETDNGRIVVYYESKVLVSSYKKEEIKKGILNFLKEKE